MLRLQIIALSVSGLGLIAIGGLLFAFGRHLEGPALRALFTLPPIGVAAYIFVVGFISDYEGNLPGLGAGMVEVARAAFVCGASFATFAGFALLLATLA